MKKHPMTAAGAEKLREELKDLKTVQRPTVIKAIAEAREHGDLKENAEYAAAREQQSFIEGRILDVEGKLNHAQIIDITTMPNNDKVIFGATVHLCHCETEEEKVYQIVGEDEAEIKENKISYVSPIAKALIGKLLDDVVEVKTPSGIIEYEINKIEYI